MLWKAVKNDVPPNIFLWMLAWKKLDFYRERRENTEACKLTGLLLWWSGLLNVCLSIYIFFLKAWAWGNLPGIWEMDGGKPHVQGRRITCWRQILCHGDLEKDISWKQSAFVCVQTRRSSLWLSGKKRSEKRTDDSRSNFRRSLLPALPWKTLITSWLVLQEFLGWRLWLYSDIEITIRLDFSFLMEKCSWWDFRLFLVEKLFLLNVALWWYL